MKTIKAQPLSREAFHLYGDYCDLLPEVVPQSNLDLGGMDLGRPYQNIAFSLIRTLPTTEMIAVMAEYHSWTGQGTLPLDGDVVMYVAPPTTGTCPIDRMEAFYVPKGTMVSLNPGVWHFTPCTVKDPVNVMLVTPRRNWANDVSFYTFTEEEKFKIEL